MCTNLARLASALLLVVSLRADPDDRVVLNIEATPAQKGPSAEARALLHRIVAEDQTFVKIHAAEGLISAGEAEAVRKIFLAERPANEASPYRVGVWRVLASTAPSAAEREQWIGKVEQLFLDPAAPNRVQALETLCKLGHRVSGRSLDAVRVLAAGKDPADAVMALWSLQLAGEPGVLSRIAGALASGDPKVRLRAGYALRWLHPTDPAVLRALARAADAEQDGTISSPFILSAAVAADANPGRAAAWQGKLRQLLENGSADARFEACQGLMASFTPSDLPRLRALLDDPQSDTRIGAACGILHLEAHRRN